MTGQSEAARCYFLSTIPMEDSEPGGMCEVGHVKPVCLQVLPWLPFFYSLVCADFP